jgi:hypothetical protein
MSKGLSRWGGAVVAALVGLSFIGEAAAQDGMPNFRSDAELRRFLMRDGALGIAVPPPPPPPPPPSPAPPTEASAVSAAPSAPDNPSITNTQVAGVDEGGIVKVSGDNLIILRRGRLFSVSTASGDLRPVDSINAYPPGVDASRDWYDEMLISGDLVIVVGESYARGGTEINRFRVSREGQFSFVDSHHLRSNDYYSSRNYASRVIGTQLVFYTPLSFDYGADDPLDALPGLSRWRPGQSEPSFTRIASARQVYIPAPLRRAGPRAIESMHTVSRCDLAQPEFRCTAAVVFGPLGRTFFVSQNAVYVWVAPTWGDYEAPRFLYRIPLDGGRPAAAQVRGGPIDQFSFNANAAASRLDVLVAPDTGGDAMWSPEFASGQPALLRLPTQRFGDGSRAPNAADYRWLPGGAQSRIDRNRFVRGRLLYSLSRWNDSAQLSQLVAVSGDDEPAVVFDMPDGVARIEQIGQDALVVGGREATTFTTIDLSSGRLPFIGDRYVQPQTRETESRSHAFFYQPDSQSPDGANGVLGLPTLRTVERSGEEWLTAEDMLFLRRSERRLGDFGRLTATPSGRPDDGCVASCVDWYGNARPIFLRGRLFALLGYEIVEGDARGDQIREARRISFAPRAESAAGQ